MIIENISKYYMSLTVSINVFATTKLINNV